MDWTTELSEAPLLPDTYKTDPSSSFSNTCFSAREVVQGQGRKLDFSTAERWKRGPAMETIMCIAPLRRAPSRTSHRAECSPGVLSLTWQYPWERQILAEVGTGDGWDLEANWWKRSLLVEDKPYSCEIGFNDARCILLKRQYAGAHWCHGVVLSVIACLKKPPQA